MLPMLQRDELDLCFALTRPEDVGGGVDGRFLFDEDLAAVTSRDHPLAASEGIPIGALAGQPLIRFRTGSALQAIIDAEFDRAGVVADYAFESFELETLRALASRGLGIALLPHSYLRRAGPPVAIVPLLPGVSLPVSLLWRTDRRRPPAAQAFLDHALEELGRAGALTAA
jgi:DNA-binding transcriptional LysR family regulator